MRIGGTIFLTVGLGLLAVAMSIAGWTLWTRSQWTQVQGTVIEEVLTPFADGNAYCPVIRFTARNGQQFTHRSRVCAWPPAYEVGESVRVFYDPANANNVQIDNFFGTWFVPLLLGFMGVIFAGVGTTLLFPGWWEYWPQRS